MQDIHDLQIDIDLKENLLVNATCKQLDYLNLIFNIYDNGLIVDLSDYEVELRALKSDQVPLIQNTNITINNNVITIKSDYQLTTTSGVVECEICLINKSTKEKKFSFNINLKVVKSVFEVGRSISKATYTLLEQLENKIDEVRDIGLNLNEAKTVNTELKGNVSTGTTLNTDLKTDITNANASKNALDMSKTNADNSKSALDIAANNANTKKTELETTTSNAETKKQEVITECGVADTKINEMKSFGDVSTLAQDVIKLKENVATNTTSLSDMEQNKANLSDVKVFTSLADIGLTVADMTTDFSANVNKIITAMGRNRKIILYPYQTESNTNLYNSLKTWCGVNTDAYRLVIESSFPTDVTVAPNKIEVYPNASDGNDKYLVGFYDNVLGTCRSVFVADSGWISVPLQSGISVNSTYTPQYRKEDNKMTIRGSVKGVASANVIAGILPVGFRPSRTVFYANFKSSNAINSIYINTLGEITIVGNTLNTYDALDFNNLDISFNID